MSTKVNTQYISHDLNMVCEEQNIIGKIRYIAKELENVSDDELCIEIDMCRVIVDKKKFGPFYILAMANLVAHNIVLRQLISEYGADSAMVLGNGITSQSEGGLSQSYAVKSVSGDVDPLDRTIYGIEYKRIRKLCLIPIVTRFG